MKKDSPNEGELIKLARKGKGLTQKQLSEKTGLAVVTIQQYERNLRCRLKAFGDAIFSKGF